MYEYLEDTLAKLNTMGTLKTIEMIPLLNETVSQKRLCRNCRRWIGGKCEYLGEIINTEACYCSWYKDKRLKNNNKRKYRSLK